MNVAPGAGTRQKAARLSAEEEQRSSARRADVRGQNETGCRTAKAVIVFRVLALICAGMNARMKLGTLQVRTLAWQ